MTTPSTTCPDGGEIGLMTAKIVLPHIGHEPGSNSIVQTKPLQPPGLKLIKLLRAYLGA